jgi:imidazolonepropionase-like amidohydrolase
MSEPAVLQAATIAGAQALGIADQVGIVETGKAADLVIVNGDPLSDIRALNQIEAVIRSGQWLKPSDLLAEAAVYAQQRSLPSGGRFDETY